MKIELRQIRQSDFDFAWQLYELLMKPLTEELLPWREDRQRAAVQAAFDSREAQIILCDGVAAGWLQTHRSDGCLYLGQIYIKPDKQGQGIGTMLVRQLIEQAGRAGTALTLSVMKNNRALSFYERLGFFIESDDRYKFHMKWKAD